VKSEKFASALKFSIINYQLSIIFIIFAVKKK